MASKCLKSPSRALTTAEYTNLCFVPADILLSCCHGYNQEFAFKPVYLNK